VSKWVLTLWTSDGHTVHVEDASYSQVQRALRAVTDEYPEQTYRIDRMDDAWTCDSVDGCLSLPQNIVTVA
jgi:hypothetical protein